jgi:hypothetical protein
MVRKMALPITVEAKEGDQLRALITKVSEGWMEDSRVQFMR